VVAEAGDRNAGRTLVVVTGNPTAPPGQVMVLVAVALLALIGSAAGPKPMVGTPASPAL